MRRRRLYPARSTSASSSRVVAAFPWWRGSPAAGSEARLLHLPQGGGDLRLAAQGEGTTAGSRCGQKGNCVGDIVGVGVPGTGHGGTHCGPMHRHIVPLPPSASTPLADRSSHSHAATTSRTADDGFVQSREDRAMWDAETTLPKKESPTTSRPPLACTSGRRARSPV
ncbi:hypothetical protein VPH35_129048 [Triticum aestivum]